MIQSLPQSAPSASTAVCTALSPASRRLRATQFHFRAVTESIQSRGLVIAGQLAVPYFLKSRVGLTWARILMDLHAAARSESEYRRMLHTLTEFVETNVIGTSDQPRHGAGLLKGQPLKSGWRRRLHVCPVSDRMLWNTSPSSGTRSV